MSAKIHDTRNVIYDHVAWFADVNAKITHDQAATVSLEDLNSFQAWCDNFKEDEQTFLNSLKALQKSCVELGMALITSSSTITEEDYKQDYQMFKSMFADLIADITRLGSGDAFKYIHPVSLLRNQMALQNDIKTELQKLHRHGTPFSLAVIKVKELDSKTDIDPSVYEGILQTLSSVVEGSVRPYDEAYHLDNDIFIVCLKYTNALGALNAFERIKEDLESKNLSFNKDDKKTFVELSASLFEPELGDTYASILEILEKRFDLLDNSQTVRFYYSELTPMQKFIRGDQGSDTTAS